MREKEKETIEDCKELVQELKQHKDKDFIGRLYYKSKPVEDILSVLLNLIEKQQKEIEHWKAGMKIVERDKNNHIERLEKELDNIKEIEKTHKEENGKLIVELKQEKEKNKILDNLLLVNKEEYKFIKNKENYISKDKIKKEIEHYKFLQNDELIKFPDIFTDKYFVYSDIIKVLEKLLMESE